MNKQFTITTLIQNEFRNQPNQLLKSSDFLAKLKNIEQANKPFEQLEYAAFFLKEFSQDYKFNAKLKKLNIFIPWPVDKDPAEHLYEVEEVTMLTQRCRISDRMDH